MTDHLAAPNRPGQEQNALIAAVIDSSPLGGILTDGEFQVVHSSVQAHRLLGLATAKGRLPDLIQSSRAMRVAAFTRFITGLDPEVGSARCHQLVESASGEPRCIQVDAVYQHVSEGRWLFWFDDVTAASHLRQFRLLAELGSGRLGRDLSTQGLADRLVDALLRVLGADIAVLTVYDRERLRPLATRGLLLEDDFGLDPMSRPFLAKAVDSQMPVVGDGSEWDSCEQEMTGSHYIVPLVASGRIMGTLHLSVLDERHAPDKIGFSRALDMVFLETLSIYAGAALANTRLFEEVRTERLKLKTVVDFIPDGVILFTGRGDVLAANETAAGIVEREWKNLNTDSRPYRLLDERGEVIRRVDWPFFRPQRDGVAVINEIVLLDFGSHQKTLSVNVIPVPPVSDDAVPTYVATLRDITRERDRQSDREDFLQVVSHELRSPLTPLTGFLQMVRKQAETGSEVDADLVSRAEHQVARLARLIDRVLDLSRVERAIDLDLEAVDLREIVSDTVAIWANNPEGVEILISCPERPVWVEGDVDRLEQVVTNLLSNAIQHTEADGLVRVIVDHADGPRLVVADQGEGVPPEALPHIFDRFYSARHKRGGMGIGLYITRHLVEAHGGTITARSTLGEGATFEVLLPSLPH